MMTRRFTYLLTLGLLLGLADSTTAQTLMTTTTLAANVSGDADGPAATVITVTSGTGFTVNNFVWADSEQMLITAVSGTAITVRRGQNGTRTAAHDNTDRIYTGVADHFHPTDPDYGRDCTRGAGQAAYMPWINVRAGTFWTCNLGTNIWAGTSAATIVFDSRPTTF